MGLVLLLSTYPDIEAARRAARGAVESRLAACVSMARAESVYEWRGEICEENEVLAVFKTTPERIARLKESLAGAHPYDVPELVELDADAAGTYMDWVSGAVSPSRT